MSNQIVTGSISFLAQQGNKSIAETFMQADCIILVDTSGSMNSQDSRNGKSRYDVACEELILLQENLPGKCAVISFSSEATFCPGGIPNFQQGGTNMAKALQFVKMGDLPGMRFILISDGEPDDEFRTLEVAKTFQNQIDVIYVGPEENPHGRAFLEKLARATGGKAMIAERAKELAASVTKLLLDKP